LPPTLDFPHTEAASITGGYVYRGKRLQELVGAYLCGDWVTCKVWGTRFDGDRVVSHKELAQGTQRIVAFGEDHDGELYFLNYDEVGTILQLVPNEAAGPDKGQSPFPRRLSETGLFVSVKDHLLAPGVMPFSINAEQWADHATAERFLGLPGQTTVRMYDSPFVVGGGFFGAQIFFPKDGVLAKTVSLEMERGNPRTRRRLETQILHFDGNSWQGYTYRWNDEQTDATLLAAAGAESTFTILDPRAPGGGRKQAWHFPSRAECLRCHNPWTGGALAFTEAQLQQDHAYGGVSDSQLQTLERLGFITLLRRDEKGSDHARSEALAKLTNPQDPRANLNERARSYLHVNCSHCHQLGAGGTADIELRFTIPMEQTKTVAVRPVQGTFAIHSPHIVSPGDPCRSVLYYRMAKLGPGRMPYIGSEIVDGQGLRLIHDWIRQLPVPKTQAPSPFSDANLASRLRAWDEFAASTNEPKKSTVPATTKTEAINRFLASPSSALMLTLALEENRFPDSIRQQILAAAKAHSDPQIRDLFEGFLPDEERVKRLGSVIKPEQILALKGNVNRGKELFFKSTTLQCVTCHRLAGTGSDLGPDLSAIGKKYTRAQILESILEPSKSIDPKYVTYLLETTGGQVHIGLLTSRTDREVVLKMPAGKEVRLSANQVATLVPQKNSIMPELLLRDLTVEQAADLLEFLASLK
jgi:putative heme-binding domain-containing protein